MWITDVLDRYLPPSVRDSRLFSNLARRMYNGLAIDIVELKDKAFYLTRAEFAEFYQKLHSRFDQGITDLTPESLDAVLDAVRGKRVLDVACGLGYVCERLAPDHEVVGCDVAVQAGRRGTHSNVRWCDGNVEELPFRDRAFDTVVSTHTLEHVQRFGVALNELRRVARERIVVVVPHQRPYRTTFNPHIHFFPYRFSLLAWTGTERPHTLDLVGGDWLYVEDVVPEVTRRSP
ncbi:MAG TPA: class I SAM-dependent methyltransferase [Acidimicrobiia bacterium]|nr:class I SAM-dependent methyltransferase [Acidimicrobiia bacterium]